VGVVADVEWWQNRDGSRATKRGIILAGWCERDNVSDLQYKSFYRSTQTVLLHLILILLFCSNFRAALKPEKDIPTGCVANVKEHVQHSVGTTNMSYLHGRTKY
jgi:hypothetical protein